MVPHAHAHGCAHRHATYVRGPRHHMSPQPTGARHATRNTHHARNEQSLTIDVNRWIDNDCRTSQSSEPM
eukprot:scaffold31813_cov146-Isochrysis_galbana.AAC.2